MKPIGLLLVLAGLVAIVYLAVEGKSWQDLLNDFRKWFQLPAQPAADPTLAAAFPGPAKP